MKITQNINRIITTAIVAMLFAVAAFSGVAPAHAQVVTNTATQSGFSAQLAEIVRQIQLIQEILSGLSGTEMQEENENVEVEVEISATEPVSGFVNEDLQVLQDCFFSATSSCGSADLNEDGTVNAFDLAEFRSAVVYDLSGDLIVDLSAGGDDLDIIRNCFSQAPAGGCAAADLNNDGVVNTSDLGLFRSAIKYDLSGDLLVDLRDEVVMSGGEDELIVKTSSSNPDPAILQVEEDRDSDWYTVFIFDLDTGSSENDIELDSIPVKVTVSESVTFNEIVDDYEIIIDGIAIPEASVSGGNSDEAVITFEVDGEVEIEAGDRVQAELVLRFDALDADNEGVTVMAEVHDADAIDAQGSNNLDASQLSGSAAGSEHTLRTAGIVVNLESSSAEVTTVDGSLNDFATFEIEVAVGAFEEDVFISTNDVVSFVWDLEDSSGAPLNPSIASTSVTLESSADEVGDYYEISEGDMETLILTVIYTPGYSPVSARLVLESITFDYDQGSEDQVQTTDYLTSVAVIKE